MALTRSLCAKLRLVHVGARVHDELAGGTIADVFAAAAARHEAPFEEVLSANQTRLNRTVADRTRPDPPYDGIAVLAPLSVG